MVNGQFSRLVFQWFPQPGIIEDGPVARPRIARRARPFRRSDDFRAIASAAAPTARASRPLATMIAMPTADKPIGMLVEDQETERSRP